MNFEIELERTYPHPVERVWRALTDRHLLGAWLMETDFAPEAGRAFEMRCDDGEGGTDRYLCRVLEIEPPRRMLWSWILDGRRDEGETRVEFRLEATAGGTRLTMRHAGDRDPETIERFESGWPSKLEHLATALRAAPGG